VGALRPPGKNGSALLPSARLGSGTRKNMKLFRLAIWLGVVIYNLPSPASRSAAPSQPNMAGKVAKYVEAVLKPGEQGGHRSPHDALQDTLGPADRAIPWRGPAALRSRNKLSREGPFS